MMSNAEIIATKEVYALSIKGTVTLYFIDGQTLTGEITAQDTFNIFLQVDDAPVMISRQQVHYIKGEPGQAVEGGYIPLNTVEKERERTSEMPIRGISSLSPVTYQDEPESEGTLILETEHTSQANEPLFPSELPPPPPPIGDYHDDEGTIILDSSEDKTPIPGQLGYAQTATSTDDYEGTVILSDTKADDDYEGTVILSEAETASDWNDRTQQTYDTTVIFDEPDDKTPTPFPAIPAPPGLDEDDATFIFDEPVSTTPALLPPQLVCTSGPHAGQVFTVTDHMTIGRATTNDIALVQDKEISRRHSIISKDGDQYVIQDQNSLNGTFVNDVAAIGPRPLQNGDIILVGVSYFQFQQELNN